MKANSLSQPDSRIFVKWNEFTGKNIKTGNSTYKYGKHRVCEMAESLPKSVSEDNDQLRPGNIINLTDNKLSYQNDDWLMLGLAEIHGSGTCLTC